MRRWQEVVDWAGSAADSDPSPTGAFLLRQLAEYVDLAGVTSGRPRQNATSSRPDLADKWPSWMEDLAVAAPLNDVALTCRQLYGDPGSEWFVCGSGVKTPMHVRDDSRRVANLYRAAGKRVPPRLTQKGGDVITARRYLSIAYGPDNFVKSFADDDLDTRVGLVRGVGADRTVLLGLFAWAWPTSGDRAGRVLQIVERMWPDADVKSYAAPELHDHLRPDARAALELMPD